MVGYPRIFNGEEAVAMGLATRVCADPRAEALAFAREIAGKNPHAIQAGKVPVIMPRRAHLGEHVDDHQLEMAQALERAGKVAVAREAAELPDAVKRALMMQAAESP